MKKPEAGETATIIGPLIKLDLDKRNIKIWTPRGKILCEFSKGKAREINRYTGQIIEISGPGLFNRDGMVREIKDITSIMPKSEMVLERISSGSIEYPLKRSITVKLDYDIEDKSWTIRNEGLNIIATGSTWDQALKDFQDQFAYLVEHYRKTKNLTLSKGSIARKEEILSLVG
jgi:hypothetical protein